MYPDEIEVHTVKETVKHGRDHYGAWSLIACLITLEAQTREYSGAEVLNDHNTRNLNTS